jgi:D-glycero-D-manno-heptose 1,7-bisphosphate phosphatase
MLLECMNRLDAQPGDTCFVGDSLRDLEAAGAAGCEGVLVRTGNGARLEAQSALSRTRIFDDLAAFARAEVRAEVRGACR